MLKDLGLGLEAAREVKSKTELGDHSQDIYKRLSAAGLGRKDFGVIYDVLLNKKL